MHEVIMWLKRPLTEVEIIELKSREFEIPFPQKAILYGKLSYRDFPWFQKQPWVGKIEVLPSPPINGSPAHNNGLCSLLNNTGKTNIVQYVSASKHADGSMCFPIYVTQ